MLFNIENDAGNRITGYFVPDSLSGVPTIRVVSEGKELLCFAANEMRPLIAKSGRHETGQCGFSIDAKTIPDLARLKDLQIYNAETGMLVYRRSPPGAVAKKILRLETHLFPLWQFDEGLQSSFQYFAKGLESLGAETVKHLFSLGKITSIYLSGRILYKIYAHHIEANFKTFVMVQEPYDELAERLLMLGAVRKMGNADLLGLRDSADMNAAIMFAEEFVTQQLDDDKSIRRILKKIPPGVAAILSNPLTRQLTVADPEGFPARNAVASALDVLSSAAVFGLRSNQNLFRMAVGEFLQVDAGKLAPVPRFEKVPELAAALRRSRQVDAILEQDLEVYHYIMQASEKVMLANG
jgi:hypothetical protein